MQVSLSPKVISDAVAVVNRSTMVRKLYSLAWAFIALPILFYSSVNAQIDTAHVLNEIRVHGVLEKSSLPVQGIKREDFNRFAASNVAEVVRSFSGVSLKDYGGIGGMKTVSVRSLGASHTGVLLDGVPITDTQNGQIDLGKISLEQLEKVQVFNGQPTELLLPAQAFASASTVLLSSERYRPDSLSSFQGTIKWTLGSFGLSQPQLSVVQRFKKSSESITDRQWLLRYALHRETAHGRYRYRVEGDGSDSVHIRQHAHVNIWRHDLALTRFNGTKGYFNIRAHYYDSDRGLPGAVIFYNTATGQSLQNNDFFVQATWERTLAKWKVLLNGKWTNNFTRYHDPYFLNSAGDLRSHYHQTDSYGSGTVVYQVTDALAISNALDVTLSNLSINRENFTEPTRWTIQNATNVRWGINQWQLQGTLLYTHIDERLEGGQSTVRNNVSTALLATYQPPNIDQLTFRAFYKSVFRNPTFSDLYFTPAAVRNLKPEQAHQLNIGAQGNVDVSRIIDRLDWSIDTYFNKVTNKIVALPSKDLFVWSMLNMGKVHIYGIDGTLKMRTRAWGHWNGVGTLNYTFQKAIDVTDKRVASYKSQIAYTPVHTASVNVGLERRGFGIYWNNLYTSKRYYLSQELPAYRLPALLVTDFSSHVEVLKWKKPIRITGQLQNAFNKDYVIVRGFPMPGRSFKIGIQLTL